MMVGVGLVVAVLAAITISLGLYFSLGSGNNRTGPP